MDNNTSNIAERPAWKMNGFLALAIVLALFVLATICFIKMITIGSGLMVLIAGVAITVAVIMLSGLVIVQPNTAAVITFFGKYTGVIRANGIWMVVPFSTSRKVSLRVRNFNSEKLKVNDTNGNPVDIAAVVVFKVVDAAKALFDVNNYEQFVEIQSETSLRHVAAQYPYDDFDSGAFSLRSNADEVSGQLQAELQERLRIAGVEIMQARLTHLAYATEIASAMLQRQQASAILAARQIIVDGAVGMAQMALAKLESEAGMQLDEERKLNLINNLLVSIISDRSSQPIINVGSMY
jgi:regulator of protease activity HflC (stomatin/prohibitin superfamily)